MIDVMKVALTIGSRCPAWKFILEYVRLMMVLGLLLWVCIEVGLISCKADVVELIQFGVLDIL